MTTHAPTNVPQPRAVDDQNPWPGLAAFEEADYDFFKGRDDEVSALMRVIRREDLILFWGLSGLGKTSLLRAGLFPRLRAADLFPVYIRLRYDSGDDLSLWEQCFAAIWEAGERWGYEVPTAAPSGSLWEYVRRRENRFWGPGDRLVTPVLVFDQFEEVFTKGPADAGQQRETARFFQDLADAVTGAVPEPLAQQTAEPSEPAGDYLYRPGVFKVLLSFREDFLAQIAGFTPLVRTIDHNHVRMDSMSFDQALRVVADSGGRLIADGPADERDAICRRIIERVAFVATASAQDSATVDPALLSLFCRELNEQRRNQGKARIDLELVESGEASQIISRFYDGCVTQVSQGTQRVIEDWLVESQSRTRGSLALEKALQIGATARDLEFLIDKRIIRREETTRRGQLRIELTHDVLVGPAIAAGERRRLEEQRLLEESSLDEEKRKLAEMRERERKELLLKAELEHLRRQRLQRLLVLGGVLLALALGGVVFVWRAQRQAESALARAGLIEASSRYGREDRNDIALAYLAYAVRLDPDNSYARGKLVNFLMQRTWPVRLRVLHHQGPVRSAQFSRDGTRLLTASADGVSVWRLAEPEPPQRQQLGSAATFARADPTAERWVVAIGENGRVDLWDSSRQITAEERAARAKQPLLVGANDETTTWASFSPDGTFIASATYEGKVRVWHVSEPNRPVLEIAAHDREIATVQFSPRGDRLLTASGDGTARVWDVKTGEEIARFADDSGILLAAQFSPDGTRLVTASRDGKARLWRMPSVAERRTGDEKTIAVPVSVLTHAAAVWNAQFSPDGSRIVTASDDGTARVWDGETGEPFSFELRHRGPVVGAFFSNDGHRIVTASKDRSARVWDADSGLALAEPLWHEGPVQAATFSSDGERVVTASDDGDAIVWDVRPAAALPAAIRTESEARWAEFAPDGTSLLIAGSDTKARVWNSSTSQFTHVLEHPSNVTSVEVSARAQLAVTAAGSQAFVWTTDTWQHLGPPLEHNAEIIAARFSPDGTKVVTASGAGEAEHRSIRFWDARSGQPIGTLQLKQRDDAALPPLPFVWVEFDSSGRHLAAAGESGSVVAVWDISTTPSRIVRPLPPTANVSDVRLSPDAKWLATIGDSNVASLWPVAESDSAAMIGLRHDARARSARFSPRGDRIITTADDGTARLWTLPRGTSVGFPLLHNRPVGSATFSPDGTRVVTLSSDGQAHLWDSQTGDAAGFPFIHPDAYIIHSARFSPDGERLATAPDNGYVRLWHVPVGTPRDVVRLALLAETVSGYEVRDSTPVRIDDAARRAAENQRVSAARSDQSIAQRLAAWMLADRWDRTISPFSAVKISDFVRERLESGDENQRLEVQRAYPGHPALRTRPPALDSEASRVSTPDPKAHPTGVQR